jgi:hypothetical protein
MKFFELLLVLSIVLVLFIPAPSARVAEEKPLVEVGQTYQIVWSCLPQIGCYAEVLRIDAIRDDGWIDVLQCDKDGCDEKWRVKLDQALAIRPHTVGRAAN